jgi:saccharopine dehydrogenase-like protein
MRRIVVIGGLGFFGRAAVERLRAAGLHPLVASRGRTTGRSRTADLTIDAEDPASLRTGLRPGDVVIDAAGPFQERTPALAEAAIDVGFDVIDLSDSLDHAAGILTLKPRIEKAGIRVLNSCSSVSSVVAALVRRSGIDHPVRVSVFLAPATRETANAGTSGSLRHSLGRPIRVLREGRLTTARGWTESRAFEMPPPIGKARGYLMESVHALTLPRVWPSLREADFWVDSRIPGMNFLFVIAARVPAVRSIVNVLGRRGLLLARLLGSTSGGMRIEVEGSGMIFAAVLSARRGSYLTAVTPAVLAARAIVEGRYGEQGLVPPDRHVDSDELIGDLRERGVECVEQRT